MQASLEISRVSMSRPQRAQDLCVAVCCSVLQCVAVCCSVLQCGAVCCSVLQYVTVCCSVLQQYVAVCCSVVQCGAVHSVCWLHHAAPHCNTLQHTPRYNQQCTVIIYGVATVSRIDQIIGLFCRIASLLYVSFAKETYNFIDPTNCSHHSCLLRNWLYRGMCCRVLQCGSVSRSMCIYIYSLTHWFWNVHLFCYR